MSVRIALSVGIAWVVWLATIGGAQSAELIATADEWPDTFRQDANLFDVCFINAQQGWAVGDRGAIWHTDDGGGNWQLQRSPVSFRLESVHFVSATHGWAAGGFTVPYTHRAVGGIVTTVDGGRTWTYEPHQFLPWLKGIFFSDAKNGIAYGGPSSMYPSGLFLTRDGGLNWSARPGQSSGWIHGAVDSRGSGWLLERNGHLSQLTNFDVTGDATLANEPRWPQRLNRAGTRDWYLCGNQGLVLHSDEGNGDWRTPRALPSADLLAEFDWQAIASAGQHVWIAGVPGTRMLHTSDTGRTWHWQTTGQSLPIYSLEFVD